MGNVDNGKLFRIPEKKETSDFSNVIPGPSDKSVILWRYIDLAKLIALLNDKKLHFARADVFQDQHEGSITIRMREALKNQFADKVDLVETLSNFRRLVKESTFISCWCMGPESEAMWKLYSGDNHGVAITVAYQDIEASCSAYRLHIAPVKYIDYQNEGFPQDNVLYPFFHKRQEFAYQKEVRIIKWCSDQMPIGMKVTNHQPTDEEKREHEAELKRGQKLKLERGPGISLEFDVEKLVRDIVVHPYAPEWYFRIVKFAVERFAPIMLGKVRWSSMRTEPLY
jgi:hypothetical protein